MFLCVAGFAPPARPADAAVPDEAKIPPWFRELLATVQTNSQRAKEESEAKLAEARGTGDRVTECYALLGLSSALRRQNDLAGALVYSRTALALAEIQGEELLKFNANFFHGISLKVAGDLPSAIEHLLRSLSYADTRQSLRARFTTVSALGSAYERLGDYPRSLTYKREALALAEQATDAPMIALYAGNLASLEETMGDPAAARRDYERALAIVRTTGNRTNLADVQEHLAMLDFTEGQTESAYAALGPILAQRRTLRGKVKLTNTLCNVAQVLQKLGRLDEALAHVEEARTYADSIDSRNLRAVVYHRLAVVQEAAVHPADALASTRREFMERQALAGEAAKNRAAELQIQFDVAKKDQELARLARANEVEAAERLVHNAQLAQNAAELRAKDAEITAAAAELRQTRLTRYALGGALGTGMLSLAAIVAFLRYRLRAEHRILEQTRTARDAALEADRLKTRFLGIASHDIRGPLGNILNLTDSLRTAPKSEQAADLDLIGAEAQRVLGLVEDLLATAALESGKLELRPAPTDLTEIAHAVLGSLRWQAAAKGQALVLLEPAPDTGRLHGDAARLYQVIANLVTNAIKFSPPGGTVTLTVAREQSLVTLSVRDEGPGVPPDEVARLFTPFSRLSSLPTGSETSHGLGLSIAHEIVRLHGGSIHVASPPGHGATFTIAVPAHDSTAS